MSEALYPTQEQLRKLSEHAHTILREHGENINESVPRPDPFNTINGIPIWEPRSCEVFHFSVASAVLQQLKPESAAILGISINDGPTTTDFTYEPLHFSMTPPNNEYNPDYLEGGTFSIDRDFIRGQDCLTIHRVELDPEPNIYQAHIQILDDNLPSEFEPEFTVRTYNAAWKLLSLIPAIYRQEF